MIGDISFNLFFWTGFKGVLISGRPYYMYRITQPNEVFH